MEGSVFAKALFIEADLGGADCHLGDFTNANFTRALVKGVVFRRAILRKSCMVGADLRSSDLEQADVGDMDLAATRVQDNNLRLAESLAFAKNFSLRIADCYYDGHCGRSREVWGTLAGLEAFHAAKHPELPLMAMPISVEEGADRIAVALKYGQAAWVKGLK